MSTTLIITRPQGQLPDKATCPPLEQITLFHKALDSFSPRKTVGPLAHPAGCHYSMVKMMQSTL